MPNRIIKESICTSQNLNDLSPQEEIFFYRLIVTCDDYGRMDARLPILRSKCFPLKLDTVSNDQIGEWLANLVNNNLVTTYSVNDQAYLQVTTWEEHQRIRAKRSKYPDINGNKPSTYDSKSPSNDSKSPPYAPVIQSNPIQSNHINLYKRRLNSIFFKDTGEHLKSSDVLSMVEKHMEEFLTIDMDDLEKLVDREAKKLIKEFKDASTT